MSIATLKKKTQAKYNNMSVGLKQFSLNGTHRSQGYVGQTSLSRSLPKTMMKGNVVCGHGGCCGTFPKNTIIQSAVISLNDPKIVKPSVVSTIGMLERKYQWVKRPQPYSSTKPSSLNNLNDQGSYIKNVIKSTILDANNPSCNVVTTVNNNANCSSCNYDSYFRQLIPKNTVHYYPPLSSSEYIFNLNSKCIINNVIYISNKTHNTPFGCNSVIS